MMMLKLKLGACLTRSGLMILAAALALSACKEGGTAGQSVFGGAIAPTPTEIADTCFAHAAFGASTKLKTAEVFNKLNEIVEPNKVAWEQTSRGYIWRAVKHVALEQRDLSLAVEFVVDPNATGGGDLADCGPAMLKWAGALVDGERVENIVLYNDVFAHAVQALSAEASAQQAATPNEPEMEFADEPAAGPDMLSAQADAVRNAHQPDETSDTNLRAEYEAEAEYYANQSDDAAE